jgi:hypothetical protein
LINITVTSTSTGTSYGISTIVDDPLPPPVACSTTAAKLVFLQSPVTGTSTAGSTFGSQPRVAVEGSTGQYVCNDLSFLTLSINPVNGSSGATLSGCAGSEFAGVVSFTGCSSLSSGNYTLTATDGSLTQTSNPFTVSAGQPAELLFSTSPSQNTVAGVNFSTQPVVSVEDAYGNVVTSDSSTVTLSITPGTGTSGAVVSSCVGTETNGLVGFTGCSISTAGTGYTLTATDGSLIAAVSSTFNVNAGPANHLFFTTSPNSTSISGVAFATQPVVTLEDVFGNVVTNDSSAVTLAITPATDTSGAVLSNSCSGTESSGVVSFTSCSVNKAGTGYTLTATAGSLTSATSSAFAITPGTPSKFVITSSPVSGVASVNAVLGPITVQEQDASGNLTTTAETVNLNSSDPVTDNYALTSGGASITSVSIPVGSSSASFYYDDSKSGTPTVTVSGSLTSASQVETITPGTASQLIVTTQPPSTSAAGTNFTTAVSVEDANGNTVTSSSTAVTLAMSSNTGGSTLGCTTNPVNDSIGVATFSCSLNKVGTGYTLKATSGTLTSATSSAFAITPGTASQLVLSGSTASLVAGSTRTLTATIEDANGNTVTSATTAVGFSLTNPAPGSVSFAAPSATSGGVATDVVTGNLAGSVSLQASASGVTNSNLIVFTITPGSVSRLGFTSSAISGTASTSATNSFTVAPEDAFGNATTSSSAITVNLSSSSSGKKFASSSGGASITSVSLPANAASVTAFYGDTAAGSPTITAAATGLTSGTQVESIVAATASQLTITSSAVSGTASLSASLGPITVQEKDTFGNISTTALTVNLTSTDPSTDNYALTSGGASITSISIPAGSSSKSFFFGDTNDGTPTITASSGSLTSATQIETITAGPAAEVAISPSPASDTASSTTNVQLNLQLQDQFGNNTVSSGTTTLTLSTSSAKGFFATATGTTGTFGGTINVTFANAAGTGSTFYGDEKAASPTITAKNGTAAWGTGTVTITGGQAAGISFTNVTLSSGGTPSVICPGTVGSSPFACTLSAQSPNGSGQTFTGFVVVVDQFQNPTANPLTTTIPITLTQSGGKDSSITPATVNILAGASTSASFKETLSAGTGGTAAVVTASAAEDGVTVVATLTDR